MVPRTVCLLVTFLSMLVGMRLCYVGSGQRFDKPLCGIRRTCFERIIKYHCSISCLIFGYKPTHIHKHENQVDYSKYLGPNWRENKFKGKRVSTQVANHTGMVDVYLSLSQGKYSSLISDSYAKKYPGLAFTFDAFQTVWVDRAGS